MYTYGYIKYIYIYIYLNFNVRDLNYLSSSLTMSQHLLKVMLLKRSSGLINIPQAILIKAMQEKLAYAIALDKREYVVNLISTFIMIEPSYSDTMLSKIHSFHLPAVYYNYQKEHNPV